MSSLSDEMKNPGLVCHRRVHVKDPTAAGEGGGEVALEKKSRNPTNARNFISRLDSATRSQFAFPGKAMPTSHRKSQIGQ